MKPVTMTAEEAEALFEAAEYARKNRWSPTDRDTLPALNRAVSKLRRASVIHIEQGE